MLLSEAELIKRAEMITENLEIKKENSSPREKI